MKLTKVDIKKIEDLGWNVRENTKDFICIRNYSPAGEDMTLEVNSREYIDGLKDLGGALEFTFNLTEDLITACENFDVDEHFELWYGANNGEPSTPRLLLQDCEAQAKMYEALAEALK